METTRPGTSLRSISRVPWVRGACSLALCDLRRAGVRCRSPTLRSLSYPGELWIFAERCASSERSGPYTPGLPCDQSVPGACSLALSDLRRVGVRCRSPTLRSLSYPVNCGSSRKGVTHQSVLGHISGCRLQNCCSSHGSRNIRLPISKLPFFNWFSEYLRLPNSKLLNHPTITLLETFTPRLVTPRGLF